MGRARPICRIFNFGVKLFSVFPVTFLHMIETNFKGTFWGCKLASQNLQHGGNIINVSSLAGKRGSANNSVYCATKFAVNGITQALAKELGARGLRVNAVCPVYVETQGLRSKGRHTLCFHKDLCV